jgi:hypothetical protein
LLIDIVADLLNFSRNLPRDIRLDDIFVILFEGKNAGLVIYDLDKEIGKNRFQLLRFEYMLVNTEIVIRSAINNIKFKIPNNI